MLKRGGGFESYTVSKLHLPGIEAAEGGGSVRRVTGGAKMVEGKIAENCDETPREDHPQHLSKQPTQNWKVLFE